MVILRIFRPIFPLLWLAATAIAMGTLSASSAQTVATDGRRSFDIPAQSLDSALTEYFRETGVQLLYDSALTAGRRSSAVRGNYSLREALRLLLAGTKLIARYSRANAAILTNVDTAVDAPLIPLGRVVLRERAAPRRLSQFERMTYYGQIEDALQARLRNDERTKKLIFTIFVQLRINDDGRVDLLKINRGTGDRSMDRLLTEVLTGTVISKPPEGLTQPLIISLIGKRYP